jgi:chromosome segregation ATPase
VDKYNILAENFEKVKEDLKSEILKVQNLENDFKEKLATHEEEVSLRLKFENKMNDLHSLHRDLENKYKRALQELADQEDVSKKQAEHQMKLQAQVQKFKSDNIKKETVISSLENEIQSLETQLKR